MRSAGPRGKRKEEGTDFRIYFAGVPSVSPKGRGKEGNSGPTGRKGTMTVAFLGDHLLRRLEGSFCSWRKEGEGRCAVFMKRGTAVRVLWTGGTRRKDHNATQGSCSFILTRRGESARPMIVNQREATVKKRNVPHNLPAAEVREGETRAQGPSSRQEEHKEKEPGGLPYLCQRVEKYLFRERDLPSRQKIRIKSQLLLGSGTPWGGEPVSPNTSLERDKALHQERREGKGSSQTRRKEKKDRIQDAGGGESRRRTPHPRESSSRARGEGGTRSRKGRKEKGHTTLLCKRGGEKAYPGPHSLSRHVKGSTFLSEMKKGIRAS